MARRFVTYNTEDAEKLGIDQHGTIQPPSEENDNTLYGYTLTISETIAKGNYKTAMKLRKGFLYTYTNNSGAPQTLDLYGTDGTVIQALSSNLVNGASIHFIPVEDAEAIGGWHNATICAFTLEMRGLTDLTNAAANAWAGKKWASYGDSITAQGLYQPLVAKEFGFTWTNHGLTGSSVADGNDNGVASFRDESRISALPTDADVVTIMGGCNDFNMTNGTQGSPIGELSDTTSYDTTTFIGGLCETIRLVQNQCPNALVILMSTIPGRGISGEAADAPYFNIIGLSSADYAKATEEVANFMGVPFIDLHKIGITPMNRVTYISDYCHPNTAGAELMARPINAWFRNNYPLT